MSASTIRSIPVVSVYVDNYEDGLQFYRDVLGLQKSGDMGPTACVFEIGEQNLLLIGGYKTREKDSKTIRTTFMFQTESTTELYEILKEAGAPMLHEGPPQDMGGKYWFACYDPAGNIIEFTGGK